MNPEILTIGVYGFTEADFFSTLVEQKIDLFCDIRSRRGMRGRRYSFVNSTYLQKKLKELGIQYVHYKNLAPNREMRTLQKEHDTKKKIKKQERLLLSQSFIQAYENECLSNFEPDEFINNLGSTVKKVVLFCVESNPEACHRSIVANKLSTNLGINVEHIQLWKS